MFAEAQFWKHLVLEVESGLLFQPCNEKQSKELKNFFSYSKTSQLLTSNAPKFEASNKNSKTLTVLVWECDFPFVSGKSPKKALGFVKT